MVSLVDKENKGNVANGFGFAKLEESESLQDFFNDFL